MNNSFSSTSRRVAAAFLLSALAVSSAASQSKASDAKLLKLQQDWAVARKTADMTFLNHFYAEEFTVGVMDGGESSRAQDLAMFSSGDLKPSVIEDTEMHVNIYGEAAMVTGLEHLEGFYKGHSGKFDLRFTNVFVHRDGRWQLVRHQAAQVQKH